MERVAEPARVTMQTVTQERRKTSGKIDLPEKLNPFKWWHLCNRLDVRELTEHYRNVRGFMVALGPFVNVTGSPKSRTEMWQAIPSQAQLAWEYGAVLNHTKATYDWARIRKIAIEAQRIGLVTIEQRGDADGLIYTVNIEMMMAHQAPPPTNRHRRGGVGTGAQSSTGAQTLGTGAHSVSTGAHSVRATAHLTTRGTAEGTAKGTGRAPNGIRRLN